MMLDVKTKPPAYRSEAYIDGEWCIGRDRFDVLNPANGALIASVANLGAVEAENAVRAAQTAFGPWSQRTAADRGRILRRWFDLITAESERLAALITLEEGKPLAEAKFEVTYGASFIDWYAEEAKRAYGRVIPTTTSRRRYVTIRQPIGVCAAITPWNFPLAMITRKAAPAIAAGNTFVVKPPAQTPLSALALAELAEQAGLPRGVLNVITTTKDHEVGRVLCESPIVRKFSFTGSTAVGKKLGAACVGANVKRISLELGGNAPLIVFGDADLDLAVKGVLISKFRNAGQTCICSNRILIEDTIYDDFLKRFTSAVKALQVGPGDQPNVAVGPLIDKNAMAKVCGIVREALDGGAQALVGGVPHPAGDQFFSPTVLVNVNRDMRASREEIFGPVAPLIRFSGDDEAVEIANDTQYGLAGYFFTRDVHRAWRVAERLDYGMVSINEGIFSCEVVPFGGIKESGLGHEGAQEGLDQYLETKFINFGGFI